jgi:alpha-tubulin suppressor-like RCC1 family protein
MSAVSTKQTNNTNWLHKAMVLFSALFLVGCSCCCENGDDNNSSYTSNENKSITAKYYQSFIIDNGKVYAAGDNDYGQLGVGDTNNHAVFTEVSSLNGKKITVIAAEAFRSLALSHEGKVYAAGNNDNRQLGLSDTYDHNVFTEVLNLSGITAIAADILHSLALSHEGKVYAVGENDRGQLGLGDNTNRNTFTEVPFLSDKNITTVAVGAFHSFALSHEGKIYVVGENDRGQLGLGDTYDRNVFTEVPSLSDKNITTVAAGAFHSLALSHEGKVYATGMNYNGQLGLGDNDDHNVFTEVPSLSDKNITAIIAGGLHSFALSHEGKVYATGTNYDGQLGLGDNTNRNTFTEIPFLSDKNITTVAAGRHHSFVLSRDGKVYTAGGNYGGQLGLGDYSDRHVFTEAIIP